MGWDTNQFASASPSPAKPLHDDHESLLIGFLTGRSLVDLAKAHRLTIEAFLDWFHSEPVQATLKGVAKVQRFQQRLFSTQSTLPALRSLANISESSPNLNHRRLSATQLLRFTQPPKAPPRRTNLAEPRPAAPQRAHSEVKGAAKTVAQRAPVSEASQSFSFPIPNGGGVIASPRADDGGGSLTRKSSQFAPATPTPEPSPTNPVHSIAQQPLPEISTLKSPAHALSSQAGTRPCEAPTKSEGQAVREFLAQFRPLSTAPPIPARI